MRKENSSSAGYYGTYLDRIELKQLLWVAVLPLCLALLVCTIPVGVAFGQNASQSSHNASGTNVKGNASNSASSSSNSGNSSGSNGSSSSAKNQGATPSSNNAATVKVSPGSTATVTTAGNKTTVIASAFSKNSAGGSNNLALNKTGFTNTYVLTINGKIFPIKYTIKGGKLVGMLADKDRTTLVLVLNPGKNGGNMSIELPRNVIDSKGASNGDTKYQVKIDGKGVDYKEVANNVYARILSINFSKDNRFVEIIGTKIAS
jgi:hypothetical protein